MARITLLTDFGTCDGYVGAMKGVIESVFPGVIVDDISHSIGFGDVEAAGRALSRYWNRYPAGNHPRCRRRPGRRHGAPCAGGRSGPKIHRRA